MAFGGLKGTLSVSQLSITATTSATGSVAVAVGDLVYAVIGEQTGNTSTACSDNLGNHYAPVSSGTASGTVCSGRAFWSYVTVPGMLTSVDFSATGSSNNVAAAAVVIEGVFIGAPLDQNPTNRVADFISPFSCPPTGVLATIKEVVLSWGVTNHNATWAATAPNLLAIQIAAQSNPKVTIGYQAVNVTTSLSPEFTAASNPTAAILGTTSFKGLQGVAGTSAAAGTALASTQTRISRSGVSSGLGVALGAGSFREAGFTATAGPLGSYVLGDLVLGGIEETFELAFQAIAAGTGSAIAVGRAHALLVGTAAGSGAATAFSKPGSQGVATGLGTAAAAGKTIAHRAAVAAGLGSAAAGGRAITGTSGLAAGQGTATAESRRLMRSAGLAAGQGTAAAVGRRIIRLTGAAAGQGMAAATSRSLSTRAGAAAGHGTATAIGRAIIRRSGLAAGQGQATAQSKPGVNGVAAGLGTAVAGGRALIRRAGVAFGLGAAAAAGRTIIRRTGIATGQGAATAQTRAGRNGQAAGFGAAQAGGRAIARREGVGAGHGLASAVGSSLGSRAAIAAGTGAAVAIARVSIARAGNAVGRGAATALWRGIAPYIEGMCAEADHLVSRLDVAVARYQQTVTIQRIRTDPATGEISVAEQVVCPAAIRTFVPQDLEAGDVQDIRIIISPRWLGSFGLPARDDRVVVNDNPSNIEEIGPLSFCGQVVRVNLRCRG